MVAAAAAGSHSGCGQFVPPQHKNAPLWDARRVIQTQQEASDKENGPHLLLQRLNGGVLPWTTVPKRGKAGTGEVSCRDKVGGRRQSLAKERCIKSSVDEHCF